jgi:hypothetical protein
MHLVGKLLNSIHDARTPVYKIHHQLNHVACPILSCMLRMTIDKIYLGGENTTGMCHLKIFFSLHVQSWWWPWNALNLLVSRRKDVGFHCLLENNYNTASVLNSTELWTPSCIWAQIWGTKEVSIIVFFSLAENIWISVNELAISKMLPSVHHFREVSLQ